MSSEGAQLLLALISCGEFLTVRETPRCLGLWEPDYLKKDELFPTLICCSHDIAFSWGGGTCLQVANLCGVGPKED